jgi:hypothetical protein
VWGLPQARILFIMMIMMHDDHDDVIVVADL